MTILQLLIIIFAIFAFSRVLLRKRDKQLTPKEFTFWSLIWFSVILIAFVPEIIVIISEFFGIGRGVDFLTYIGLTLLFYMVFKIIVKMEKLQEEITKLTRTIALQNVKKNKK